ncbi:hypothetical protein M569_10240 [Genlisea aurea]|uniref:Uncharacterized protein n=1 Tax=Genlisea aurea TaxID=192259 RepID=S8CCC1_9LAMI|nr:hypothetical protein M569_10240 [Genlisea aurea]
MGQAFRRATGKIAGSSSETASQLVKPIERRRPPPFHPPPTAAPIDDKVPKQEVISPGDTTPRLNPENVLEVRDPDYDTMLSQIVGRIQAKPGGKLEMGEAAVVEKYRRPLPKLRNTRPDSDSYDERPAPPGTLNVKQLRQIILLHQGKSDDHDGPMDVPQIASRFNVTAAQVNSIINFVTLPPEEDERTSKKTSAYQD